MSEYPSYSQRKSWNNDGMDPDWKPDDIVYKPENDLIKEQITVLKDREQKLIEVISFAKKALETIDGNSRLLDNFRDEEPYETSEKALAEIAKKLKGIGVEV